MRRKIEFDSKYNRDKRGCVDNGVGEGADRKLLKGICLGIKGWGRWGGELD